MNHAFESRAVVKMECSDCVTSIPSPTLLSVGLLQVIQKKLSSLSFQCRYIIWVIYNAYLHRFHGKSAHLPATKYRTLLALKFSSSNQSKVNTYKSKKEGTVMYTLLNPSCMNVSPPGTSYWRMSSPRLMASLWIRKKKIQKKTILF